MAIKINIDVMLAKRKMSEVADTHPLFALVR